MSGNNPLTDKHVGPIVSNQGWDNEYSEIRQKVGLDTEETRHRKTRKDSKKKKLSCVDFPVSPKNRVAIKRDNNGYINHFLYRVIDSYKEEYGGFLDKGDVIFIAILDSEHTKYDYLVGHIKRLELDDGRSWMGSALFHTKKTKSDFVELKKISRNLEPKKDNK